jgi:predicted membrane protein
MENAETKPYRRIRPEHNNKWGGWVLIIIGVLFLLNKIPQTAGWFPHWFLSWPVLLIGLGLFTGVKSRFQSPAWVILCLIGGYFLLYENNWVSFNLRPYAVPVGIILLGILFIFKRKRRCNPHQHHGRFKHWQPGNPASKFEEPVDASEDIVNVHSIFGSVERNIFSKDFKGATISSVFGGAQVNFVQADFQGTAVVDVSIIFGGADIIIPSNWNLRNEISVIFGGIEDRRTVAPNVHESGKTLILRGDIVFGGVEIKSY